MEAAIYKISINFQYFLNPIKFLVSSQTVHFLCRLQIMVVTYGSCLGRHRRLLSCPRCNTFGF